MTKKGKQTSGDKTKPDAPRIRRERLKDLKAGESSAEDVKGGTTRGVLKQQDPAAARFC
jgi:hypothetical protein